MPAYVVIGGTARMASSYYGRGLLGLNFKKKENAYVVQGSGQKPELCGS